MKNSINIGKLLVIPYDSYSNYINLPPSSLDRLSKLNTTNTYFFELKTNTEIVSYVGVKEFISEESCIEVPTWLAESLGVDYVNITLIKNIPKGEFIKIEPLSEKFFDLPDNDKLVETELANYCLLQLNQIIPMKIFDTIYEFKIVEIKDHDIIDITNIDLNVDFINKFLKEENVNKFLNEEVVTKFIPHIPEKNNEIDDFANMFSSMLPVLKNDTSKEMSGVGNIIGGSIIDINKVREARLKYFENKNKEMQNKSEPVEVKPEPVEVKPEPVEVKPEPVEVKLEPVEVKPESVQVKEKRKYVKKIKEIQIKSDIIDTDKKLIVEKPKRKYTKGNK